MLPHPLQQAAHDLQQQLLVGSSSHRAEAKSWLHHTLSQLQNVSPAARRACFHPCPDTEQRSSSSPLAACKPAELQLLQTLAEAVPADVSALLLRDPDFLRSFLTSSRDTIKAWFQHFGPTSIQHFKWGARALANYALAERQTAWQHLVWVGKHSQSPVAVAVKHHYFAELDVVATVHNLASSCPGFWRSDECMRSCQDGAWLGLDRDAVAKELRRLLHEPRSSRQQPLQRLLSEFLASADWVLLCHRLLPLLPDSGLLQVVSILASTAMQAQQQGAQQQHSGSRGQQRRGNSTSSSASSSLLLSSWCSSAARLKASHVLPADCLESGKTLEQEEVAALQSGATAAAQLPCVTDSHMLLLGCVASAAGTDDRAQAWTLDQLLLANALTCYRSQLLAMLWQDDDSAALLMNLVRAAGALCAGSTTGAPAPAAAAAAAGGGGATGGTQQRVGPTAEAVHAGLSELPSAVRHLPRAQQLTLLLTAGWLLRLSLLLQLSEGASADVCEAEGTAGAQQPQQQQQQQQQAVRLPTGAVCYFLQQSAPAAHVAAGAAAAAHPLPSLQQEQPQLPAQAQLAPSHAQQTEHKQPLRRGLTPARSKSAQHQRSRRSSRSGDSEGAPSGAGLRRSSSKHKHSSRRRRSSKSKLSKSKHRRRHKRTHRNSSSLSGSDNDDDGGASDSSGSSSGRARRERKRRRRSRHTTNGSSSSDGGSGDEAGWAGMDLDAGGELLDPAAFNSNSKPRRSSAAGRGDIRRLSLHTPAPTVATGAGAEAARGGDTVAAVGEACSRDGDAVGERGRVDKQHQPAADNELAHVVEQLSSLAVGGRLWQWPQCVAVVPSSSSQREGQECGVVTGSIVEVADAVAQLWLVRVLQQVV